MDFFDCVEQRTTIRRFKSTCIEDDDLLKIISSCRIAPSAANLQPLEYIIINEKDKCDMVFPHTSWAGYLTPSWTPDEKERPTAYIFILNTQPDNPYVDFDVGISMASICLSAQAMDLGSCILCKIHRNKLKQLFKIPDSVELKAIIALGHKNEMVRREDYIGSVEYWRDEDQVFHVPKKSLDSMVHRQIYNDMKTMSKD